MNQIVKIGDMILPVNPSEITVDCGRAVKNEDVDGVGETSHHNGTKLTTITSSPRAWG